MQALLLARHLRVLIISKHVHILDCMQVGFAEVKASAYAAAGIAAFAQLNQRAELVLGKTRSNGVKRRTIMTGSFSPDTVQLLRHELGSPDPKSDGQHHLEMTTDIAALQRMVALAINPISG